MSSENEQAIDDRANTAEVERLRKELFSMQAQQKKIEEELMMHNLILENNKVGMTDELVDKDDFPRNDIDVWAVRQARSSIRKLQNDAKELFNLMKSKLEEIHSLTRPQ